ncbi:hypothetical protein VOLCADRAFT_104962 [Volvox carteri f. nagariensis]|uniref:DUF98 domain-containing protein n=1 Tax=Volvox carteri f. nagariensis TaxID=3068 RepID=D8TXF7_VOLCA|nr:uncharacterized protein VOLCADRAFT_104962 [Volvox carteri f. nagariensis]EFJ47999.1 hypothetical protein VOLCADRAFT_104962 [Volvox carteri f. nagariensis]|eukprot:XP_002951105.1 hypothetical protein VOLCADRAFT_104962 [Volvox carteri f. nagariensis]
MPCTAIDSWASQGIHAKCAAVAAFARSRKESQPVPWVWGQRASFGSYRRRAPCLMNAWSAHRLRQMRAFPGPGGASTAHNNDGSGANTSAPSSYAGVSTTTTWPSNAAGPPADEAPPFWPALQPPFSYNPPHLPLPTPFHSATPLAPLPRHPRTPNPPLQASAEDAQSNAVPSGLSPMWKVLLLSDGSVTRHLQLLSGSPVAVECLSMRNVGWSLEGLPPGTELIPGPRVQRQVLLRCQPVTSGLADSNANESSSSGVDNSAQITSSNSNDSGGCGGDNDGGGRGAQGPALLPLVYASSWWNADTVDEYLRDKSKPIWVSLSQGHIELYREVHALFCGCSPPLEQLMGCAGPFWGRHYVFWSGGRPLTLIYEVFSPRLRQYLGPVEESSMGRS